MKQLQLLAQPLARLLLAFMFIMSGYSKIGGYAGTQGYMEAMGVPGMLLPLVIALELVGGIAIVVGWQTRLVAFLLAGFSLVSAVLFHFNPSDQMQMIMFMKNVSIAGGFLLLVAHGAGAFSLDNRRA
ncbi:DoxX family protein [Agarivorans sp. MS3-6]|uniref:DoxX family protein n=1 Tax=Agarivorans sp. TSD2052 TaxID=2937286 RepID=UPI00201063CC|nr:DoxX family protein [Agarivorans sp. TSD2052]UPW18589.1 DoxX family protein [Agarivorans sp. TSD2052]